MSHLVLKNSEQVNSASVSINEFELQLENL